MEPVRGKRRAGQRIQGRFVALSVHLINSAQFVGLTHASARLLIYIAAQYTGRNNGRLLATNKYLRDFGWNSNRLTSKCLKELLDAGLIVRTCRGSRPNRAANYAITWRCLDVTEGFDEDFDPKQYRQFVGKSIVVPKRINGADIRGSA